MIAAGADAPMAGDILLPFPPGCVSGVLQRRFKRFFVEFLLDGRLCLAHTNNSGSMLGLLRPGSPVVVSPAPGAGRKLPYTLELLGLPGRAPEKPMDWVGVNTLTPNRLLRAAFVAGRLPWAAGYTFSGRGQTRAKPPGRRAERPRTAASVGGMQKRHPGGRRCGGLSGCG